MKLQAHQHYQRVQCQSDGSSDRGLVEGRGQVQQAQEGNLQVETLTHHSSALSYIHHQGLQGVMEGAKGAQEGHLQLGSLTKHSPALSDLRHQGLLVVQEGAQEGHLPDSIPVRRGGQVRQQGTQRQGEVTYQEVKFAKERTHSWKLLSSRTTYQHCRPKPELYLLNRITRTGDIAYRT